MRHASNAPQAPSRREMLCRAANGFGGLALAALMVEEATGTDPGPKRQSDAGARAAPRGESEVGHLFVHGWGAFAD